MTSVTIRQNIPAVASVKPDHQTYIIISDSIDDFFRLLLRTGHWFFNDKVHTFGVL